MTSNSDSAVFNIAGSNFIQFNNSVTGQGNRIGYNLAIGSTGVGTGSSALDIIGYGTGSSRNIKLWDTVTITNGLTVSAGNLSIDAGVLNSGSKTSGGVGGGLNIYNAGNDTTASISSAGAITALSLSAGTGGITTSGNISTTGTGYITSAKTITAGTGLTVTAGNLNIDAGLLNSGSKSGGVGGGLNIYNGGNDTTASITSAGAITGNTITLNGVTGFTAAAGLIAAKGLYINGTEADSGSDNSIKATGQIEARSFNVVSDIRIKKNIEYQNTNSSLETIKLLKPTKYDFIDSNKKKCHGFLAQELEEILPNLITNTKNYIPNIFSNATVNDHGFKVTILNEKFSLFDLKNKENAKIEYTDASNNSFYANIKKILNEKTFIVEEKIDFDTIFIKGEEVEDFKSIDPIQIISLNTASIIELDKELSEAKNRINDLENKINELFKKI